MKSLYILGSEHTHADRGRPDLFRPKSPDTTKPIRRPPKPPLINVPPTNQ